MWQPAVLKQVARLSKPGTRIATFTVARDVRDTLSAAGFRLDKRPGPGSKREVLSGHFEGGAPASNIEPWFAAPAPSPLRQPQVAVIGAGVAGASLSHAFTRRGCSVTVVERRPAVAQEASSVPAAIYMPRLSIGSGADTSFYAAAWRYGLNLLSCLESEHAPAFLQDCGVLQLATSALEAERLEKILEAEHLPKNALQLTGADQTSDIAGVSLNQSGLFIREGGWIKNKALCQALLQDAQVMTDQTITSCLRINDQWALIDADGTALLHADVVVLANGLQVQSFSQGAHLPLTARLGQMSFVKESEASRDLRCVIAGERHITPPLQQHHVIGATFDHFDARAGNTVRPVPVAKADAENLEAVQRLAPGVFARTVSKGLSSWVGLRCTTPDHVPVAGPAPDDGFYALAYAELHHGRHWVAYPDALYHEGLFTLTGLGARGVVTAPLAAELIASQVLGEPWPVPIPVAHALHPGRFMIRSFKRNSKQAR